MIPIRARTKEETKQKSCFLEETRKILSKEKVLLMNILLMNISILPSKLTPLSVSSAEEEDEERKKINKKNVERDKA